MTTVTKGSTTLRPLLLLGYSSTKETTNIVHKIIGRADPDVTMSPANLRTGTLRFLLADKLAAQTMENLHTLIPGVLTFSDTGSGGVNMRYVANGAIVLTLDPETLVRYTIDIPFQEVL